MASKDTVIALGKKIGATESRLDKNYHHRPEWGDVAFEGIGETISIIRSLLSPISKGDLTRLTEEVATELSRSLDDIGASLAGIDNFTIKTNNPEANRDNLLSELRRRVDSFTRLSMALAAYLMLEQIDLARINYAIKQVNDQVNDRLSEAQEELKGLSTEVIAKASELDRLTALAKSLTASSAVSKHAERFSGDADAHEVGARQWLKATAAGLLATLAFAGYSYCSAPHSTAYSVPSAMQVIAGKVVILFILVGATLWCGRIYKSHKHQGAVNRHRANALETFDAFISSTSDLHVKDAILLETARSIFAHTSSGYIEGKDNTSESNTKILEIFKNQGG